MEEASTEMMTVLPEQDVQLESVRKIVEQLGIEYVQGDGIEEDSKARSDAITLIRARTFTRYSQSGSCSPVTSPDRDSVPGKPPTVVSPSVNLTFSEIGTGLPPRQRNNKKKNQKRREKKKKGVVDIMQEEGMRQAPSDVSYIPASEDQVNTVSVSDGNGKVVTANEIVSSNKIPMRQRELELKTASDESAKPRHDLKPHSRLIPFIVHSQPQPPKKPNYLQKHCKQSHLAKLSAAPFGNEGKYVDSHPSDREAESEPVTIPSANQDDYPSQQSSNELHTTEKHQGGHAIKTTRKLSPIGEIDEASKEARQDNASTSQHKTQNTPAPATSEIKLKGKRALSSPLIIDSNSHPTLPQKKTTQLTTSGQSGPLKPQRRGFFWQLDSTSFICEKAGCDKRCNLWDGVTQICPRCGPCSEVRYCSREHLYVDIKHHWAFCCRRTFRHPCLESSIPRSFREGPPLLPCLHNWDSPERHRQAVYHATTGTNSITGDYVIFADWEDFIAAGRPANTVTVRCSTRIICIVRFEEPSEKDRFRRILGVCLFASVETLNLVQFMYRLIRDNLRARGVWSFGLDNALRYQIQHELAVNIDSGLVGHRHACETEWDGRNPRHCQKFICCTEYQSLLHDYGTRRAYRQFCDFMESSYWILRAARITHPFVTDVAARTRGEGFENVLEDDKRHFCRGEGWDGAGSGGIEIEGLSG